MIKKIVAVLILAGTVSSQTCLAGAADSFVYVVPDSTLASLKKSREQANKECPPCERRWRQAWASEGKKTDTSEDAMIRKSTSKPKD